MKEKLKNLIDLAYLTGVFNVSGIDGLSNEIKRLKDIGKKPHEIFADQKSLLGEPVSSEQRRASCEKWIADQKPSEVYTIKACDEGGWRVYHEFGHCLYRGTLKECQKWVEDQLTSRPCPHMEG